jgi:hypothetical protein
MLDVMGGGLMPPRLKIWGIKMIDVREGYVWLQRRMDHKIANMRDLGLVSTEMYTVVLASKKGKTM